MRSRATACLFFLFFGSIYAQAYALNINKPSVHHFIDTLVKEHQFHRGKLTALLASIKPDPHVIQSIEHPAESLPWYRYESIFLTPKRIVAGRNFMQKHRQALTAAKQRYGVSPSIITALLGMESYYGDHEGRHSALVALATLAFFYPPRSRFFQEELADYLLLCRENGFNPKSLKSSYAGALGAPQFMPSSYLSYAVDTNGNGANLWGQWRDIIFSVAHFLSAHGWRNGGLLAAPASVPAHFKYTGKLGNSRHSISQLKKMGIHFQIPTSSKTKARLVSLQTRKGPQYWVTLHNFSVLMHYNGSTLYAMAATQLAAQIDNNTSPRHRRNHLADASKSR